MRSTGVPAQTRQPTQVLPHRERIAEPATKSEGGLLLADGLVERRSEIELVRQPLPELRQPRGRFGAGTAHRATQLRGCFAVGAQLRCPGRGTGRELEHSRWIVRLLGVLGQLCQHVRSRERTQHHQRRRVELAPLAHGHRCQHRLPGQLVPERVAGRLEAQQACRHARIHGGGPDAVHGQQQPWRDPRPEDRGRS